MRAGRTRQHPANVRLNDMNVRRTRLGRFLTYCGLVTPQCACLGYDRIKENQPSVPRPSLGNEVGGEVVAPSHTPHSTSDTKRSNTAA